MKLTEETSENLRALAFLCALFVVPIHCWSEAKWFAGIENCTMFEAAVKLFLSCSFSRIAVPFFFVLTGFFLALNFKPTAIWYVQMLKKRAYTIYLPFVIWNALNVALCLVLGKEGYGEMGVARMSAKVFGWNLYESVGCRQFWYLQTVIIWMFISPLVCWVLKRKILASLSLSFLAWGWAVNLLRYPQPLAVGNFLWLSIGTVAAFALCGNKTSSYAKYMQEGWMKACIAIMFGAAVAGRVAAGLYRHAGLYNVFDKCMIPIGLAMVFVNASAIARSLARLRSLWGLSFFIYAFHSVMISVATLGATKFGAASGIEYPLKMTIAFIGTIAIGSLIRKRASRIFAVIAGGRR